MQRIHGLTIRADVALPGIASAHAPTPDAVLELVDRLAAPIPVRGRYRAGSADDVTTRVEVVDDARGCTTFRYGDGTAIDVDHRGRPARIRAAIAPGQTLEDLTAYLYGPVLGFLLRTWGRLAMHASCVRVGDGAVLLAGPPGAGKSTTAAALATRGLTVVADDLTALALDDGDERPRAWPAFDHLRLCPAGERVVFGDAGRLERITPGWEKRRFPLDGAAFAGEPVPVRAIVVLRPRRDGRTVVRSLTPARALVTLATLTYANYLLDPAMRAHELMQLGALVRAVPVRTLTPAAGRENLDALCDAIVRAAEARTPAHA
ncbi:MAG: hypothetical protein ACJ79A_05415 [Gemmatimonadaceae bacterium]